MQYKIKKMLQWIGGARFSLFIAALTAITSSAAAFLDTGSVLGIVKVKDLHRFGGVRLDDIVDLEVWRIVTAQLVHVKPQHMILNGLLLLLMGAWVEKGLGPMRTAVLWLVGGGLGTVVSVAWTAAPWDVGSGASQATFALASCALMLSTDPNVPARSLGLVVALLIVGTGLVLDLLAAGTPKPGHAVSFAIGALIGWAARPRAAGAGLRTP